MAHVIVYVYHKYLIATAADRKLSVSTGSSRLSILALINKLWSPPLIPTLLLARAASIRIYAIENVQ
jgi:hypothetical protein